MAEQLVFTRYIDRAFMARKKDVDVQTRGLGATIICCESDDVYVSVLGGANFPSFVCPPPQENRQHPSPGEDSRCSRLNTVNPFNWTTAAKDER